MSGIADQSKSVLEQKSYPSIEVAKCPYEYYTALREEAPVYQLPGRPTEFVVSRHEDVRHVFRSPELYSNRQDPLFPEGPALGDGEEAGRSMVFADRPEHTWKRKLLSKAFTGPRLKAYRPMVESYTDEIIDGFIERGRVEFVAEFSNALPIYVMGHLFGLPTQDRDVLARVSALEGFAMKYMPPQQIEEQAVMAGELGEYVSRVVGERLESPGDDLISELIAAQIAHDGELDLPYVLVETGVLIMAGLVTTTHLIENAMLLLIRNPETMGRVSDDPDLIPPLVEETLRLESPVQWNARIATADSEIRGVQIPAGSVVWLAHAAANRDEARFECPAELDLDRPNLKEHFGFGSGIHTCVGSPLARLEAQVAFERLLARLRNIALEDPSREVEYLDTVMFRAPAEMRLVFEKA